MELRQAQKTIKVFEKISPKYPFGLLLFSFFGGTGV
jgi:hypothetical protein